MKDVDLTEVSAPGTLTYTITVDNTGNVDLTNVVLTDVFAGGATLTSGDTNTNSILETTETWVYTADYEVTQADINAGTDLVNVATVDTDQTAEQQDDATTTIDQNPAISIDKEGSLDMTVVAPTDRADAGDEIDYTFDVSNDGNVTLSSVVVSDPLGGGLAVTCGLTSNGDAFANDGTDTLDPGESVQCSATYTLTQADVDAGEVNNIGFVDSTDPNGDPVNDDDPNNEDLPQSPEIVISKTFAADSVIAGGTGSSFTLLVTNTGNVTLEPAVVTDSVDSRLTVTGVGVTTPTAAGGETCDPPSQSVSCTIPTLAVNESATITVSFEAGPGALGDAPIGDPVTVEATVPNGAMVTAEPPIGDPVVDDSTDTIDIRRDINLSIVKEFDPPEIEIPIQPQGTGQFFTITVSNAGQSDADNVLVTDTVNGFLEIIDVTIDPDVTANDCTVTPTVIDPGAPPPLIASDLECSIDVAAGGQVAITVEYIVAPFLNDEQIYGDGTGDGSEFRFVFDNGSILEGNALGPVYLDGVEITAEGEGGLTKNDYLFDPDGAGGEDAFLLHLSCSDPFTGGWGQSGGPDEILNPDWQIDYFSIARYKQGGEFFRNCGNVVDTFDVDNTATATGIDWFDDPPDNDTVSDDATVIIKEGILLDGYQRKSKHASVDLTNFTGDPKVVRFVELRWPTSNGELRQINLGGLVIWQGSAPGIAGPPEFPDTFSVTVGDLYDGDPIPEDYDYTPWLADITARTLDPNVTEKLQFHFTEKASGDAKYQIRVNFDDGTFLDITIDDDTKGGGKGGGPQSQDDTPPPDESTSLPAPTTSPTGSGSGPASPEDVVVTDERSAEPDLLMAEPVESELVAAEPTEALPVEPEPAAATLPESMPGDGENATLVVDSESVTPTSEAPASRQPIFLREIADRSAAEELVSDPNAEPAIDVESAGRGPDSSASTLAFEVEDLGFELESGRQRLAGSLALSQVGGVTVDALEVTSIVSISHRPVGGEWAVIDATCFSDSELVLVAGEQEGSKGTVNFLCDLETAVPDGSEVRLLTEVLVGDGTEPITASVGEQP